MYPRRLLIGIALGAFLLGLLWGMPARFLVPALGLERAGIVVESVSGTITHGGLRATRAGVPLVAGWKLQLWRLCLLQLSAEWVLDFGGAAADGRLALAPWGASLAIARGDVPAATLSRWMQRWRATVTEPLVLRGIAVALTPTGTVRQAAGTAAWGPGEVQVAGRPAPLAMPALRGRLQRVDDGLEFVVDGESAPGQALARAGYDDQAAEVHVVLLQRGADLLGMRARNGRDPETPVFEMRQLLRQ